MQPTCRRAASTWPIEITGAPNVAIKAAANVGEASGWSTFGLYAGALWILALVVVPGAFVAAVGAEIAGQQVADIDGADHLVDLDQVSDPVAEVKRLTNGRLADVVVECTGAALMMELGLDVIRATGRYVMIGTSGYGKAPLTTDKIVFKEITVLGGLGQSWDTEMAVQIINSRKYALEKMVTDVFPLEKADDAMRHFINNPDKALRVVIMP